MKRFRGALRRTTYRRSRKETRGRKRKLSRKAFAKTYTTLFEGGVRVEGGVGLPRFVGFWRWRVWGG